MARMADKARAARAGLEGEYNYDCPIDQTVLGFLGISAADFQEAACANPNDVELGEWVLGKTSRTRAEISTFNANSSSREPKDDDQRARRPSRCITPVVAGKWRAVQDSNLRPLAPEANALSS